MSESELRREILALVLKYSKEAFPEKKFVHGLTPIPPSGKVFDGEDLKSLVDSSLDFWLTTGRFNDEFQSSLASFLGVRSVLTVNSGSSANLLALATLTSPMLGEKALKPGDEVITVAAGFPTTVNPIILYGLIPVFIDIKIPTYNIDVDLVESAITNKTRAIVLAHTLGNPFDLNSITALKKKYGLWLIEDCCDALGSQYLGKHVGTFGDIATLSFYPAHHITMGEGGAIFTNDKKLKKIAESIRDWGRDCYCPPGHDNTCNRRFDWSLGNLPKGYDHKYTYSHLGFNLKITDMQASIGVSQLKKLPLFIESRKKNFEALKRKLLPFEEFIILPEASQNSDPSWFGFPITIRKNFFPREKLIRFLEDRKIGTRLLFGGNLIRQPYFSELNYKVHNSLINTDKVMNDTFWIGLFPGIKDEMIDYVVESFKMFFKSY